MICPSSKTRIRCSARASSAAERFDRIGRVDRATDRFGIAKQRDHLNPAISPDPTDDRKTLPPVASRASRACSAASTVGAPIDLLQVSGDGLAVLPRDVAKRVSHQRHDAQLDLGPRKHALDRLAKAFEPIDARDQDVFHAAALEFGQHPTTTWRLRLRRSTGPAAPCCPLGSPPTRGTRHTTRHGLNGASSRGSRPDRRSDRSNSAPGSATPSHRRIPNPSRPRSGTASSNPSSWRCRLATTQFGLHRLRMMRSNPGVLPPATSPAVSVPTLTSPHRIWPLAGLMTLLSPAGHQDSKAQ
jgi:hypothetical protein